MDHLLRRLAERKVGQWALAYAGTAWMVLEFVDLIGETWGWSARAAQGVQIVLLLGLPITILVAWFHGEKGRQRVTGTELVSFAAIVGVGAFALSAWADQPPSMADDARRVAVMPFDYPSDDSTLTYVAEVLRDEVSVELAAYDGIDVVSRPTMLRVGESVESVEPTARELGLDVVIEGSLGRSNDQILIELALTDVDEGQVIEARRFALTGAGLLPGVVDIAAAVAVAVHPHLAAEMDRRAPEGRVVGADAIAAYARARSLIQQASPASRERARPFLDQAIQADSMWSAPYSLLTRWHALGTFFGVISSSVADSARRAATRALSLDRQNAEAYYALSVVQYHMDRDWIAADASLKSALELAPGDPEIRIWAAQILSTWGRTAEAIEHGLRAVDLDPLSCYALAQLSMAYTLGGRYQEAAAAARECLAMDPNFSLAYYRLAWAQHGAGDTEAARRTAEQALDRFGGEDAGRWQLFAADIHAHSGDDERARALLTEAQEAGLPPGFAGTVASIYVALGDVERAMQIVLDEMVDTPDPLYGLALVRLAPLREHPSFGQLLDALNPPTWMQLDAYRDPSVG